MLDRSVGFRLSLSLSFVGFCAYPIFMLALSFRLTSAATLALLKRVKMKYSVPNGTKGAAIYRPTKNLSMYRTDRPKTTR